MTDEMQTPLLAQSIADQAAAVTTLHRAFARRVEDGEITCLAQAVTFLGTWTEAINEMAGLEK